MKARLLISSAATRGEEFVIEQEATLGRSRSSSIRVDGEGVSSQHARIYFDADRGRYFLEDLESLNGTTLDGLAVTRPEPLDQLHVIGIAGVREFVFQELNRDPAADATSVAPDRPATEPGTETSVDREMPPLPVGLEGGSADADEPPTAPTAKTSVDQEMPALPANLADRLPQEAERADEAAAPGEANSEASAKRAASGTSSEDATPEAGATFALRFEGDEAAGLASLPEGERVVGRSRSADITVEGRSASRRHALLSVANGKVTLRDLESRNHTFVDGRKLTAEVELEVGARLRFGDVEAVLVEGEEGEG